MAAKIWSLLGPFYLILIFSLIVYFLVSKKIRHYLFWALLTIITLVNIFYLTKYLSQNWFQATHIFLGSEKILEETTDGQSIFAARLRTMLSPDSKGCVYWHHDVPTVYLISELYPRSFRAIEENDNTTNCRYLISPATKTLTQND